MRKHSRFLLLALCAVLLLSLSVPGVYAIWQYAEGPVEPKGENLSATLSEWKYPKYTITFMDQNVHVKVQRKNPDGTVTSLGESVVVLDNTKEFDLSSIELVTLPSGRVAGDFLGWENAGGTSMSSIPENHTTDIVLYPVWKSEYWIRFMDGLGNGPENVLAAFSFTYGNVPSGLTQAVADEALNKAQERYDLEYGPGIYAISGWDQTDYLKASFYKIYSDIVLSPVGAPVEYSGKLTFTPVYDVPDDGIPDAYIASGIKDQSQVMIEVPAYYNGKPVSGIAQDTFAGFDDLHVVTIPKTVNSIGKTAFSDASQYSSGETITIYFEGSRAEWEAITKAENWDRGLGGSTQIFFLNGGDKVDISQGYIQRKTNLLGWPNGWKTNNTINVDYSNATCDCGDAHTDTDGKRPDYIYWPAQ